MGLRKVAPVILRRSVLVWPLLAVLAVLPPTCGGEAAESAPAPIVPPVGPPSAAIPLAEVATRAAEVSELLRALTTPLAPSVEIETIKTRLPEVRRQIDLDLETAASLLRGQPTLDVLETQHQVWQRRQFQTTAWLNVLTRRATLLEEALDRLAVMRKTWRQTRTAAEASRAPGPIVRQIDAALAAIEATAVPLEAQRAAVLDLQSVVAQEVGRSGTALAQFAQAQRLAIERILGRDSSPIWSVEAWGQARNALPARVREVAAGHWAAIARYLRVPSEGLPLHVGFLAVLAVALSAARRRVRLWAPTKSSPATAVLDHPYSATAVIAMLVVASLWSPLPPTVRSLFEVLGLAPVIWLTQPATDPRLASGFYMLLALFAVDRLREAVAGVPVLEQAILMLAMLAGLAALAYSLTIGGLRRSSAQGAETERLAALRVGAGLVVLGFAVALVAGAAGYMRLARLLASGVLGSGALALTLYAGIRVMVGVVAFALRVWPLRLLQMVQHHRDLLERRIRHVLIGVAIVGWLVRSLDYVGLLQPAQSLGATVLAATLGRGSIQVSVGNILEFVLTVWLAYLVSAFIRFALREDVYPRTRLTRGLSYALSSLLNYVIIALGFVLALGVLGVDLTKLTILASAFGVGIGFGLQSVVNNFVSGLVLLFERPIHVGDIVEVGSLSGEVSRIGIRASTVRTWQGAEIIVPNAQLVTERVTNWTLSDRTRRIDLPVGVDYGSPPEKVVEVLEAVARAHPQILEYPPPQAVFTAFADSSINFELRAWTSRFERWPAIQTELAAAVYAALHAAGMSLPFPQREVRLLRDAPVGSADVLPAASPRPPKSPGSAA
jgi:small-conductance mechanosensitive channel